MNFPYHIFRPHRLIAAAFAFAGTANGDTVPTPAAGDVFVGFRASDGQGSSASYPVKPGTAPAFRNAAQGSAFDVTGLGNTGADLIATYGANWHTRADLYWGIFAVRSSVSSTVYGSRARTDLNTIAPSWPALTTTGRNGTDYGRRALLRRRGRTGGFHRHRPGAPIEGQRLLPGQGFLLI